MIIFPPRQLGVAEQWGRTVEGRIIENENAFALTQQSFENLRRTSSAQDTVIARQIEQLQGVVGGIASAQTRISETVDTGAWGETVTGNSWGELIEVNRPLWASSAVVVAGMDNFTNQSSPWMGFIELIASNSPPVTGDVEKSRDVAKAFVSDGAFQSTSNPRIVRFPPSESEDPDPPGPVYLRARAVRQSGTSSRTYSFDVAFAVIWS